MRDPAWVIPEPNGEHGADGLSRRKAFAIGAGLSLLSFAASRPDAYADVPDARSDFKQVPGVMRWKIGVIEVTAVSDGVSTLPLDVVPSADPIVAQELADAAFLPPGPAIPIAINTYVVRSGTTTVLVDTGGGRFFGPQAGTLQANLRAAGIAPESIDVLILTHLHPDHVAGMITPTGQAAFPNATLFVHEAELTYWNDDGNLSRAPAVQTAWFKMARSAIKPYAARTERITKDRQIILSGVMAEELPGHTPGHTGVRISAGSEELLIWADILHFPHLQLPEPDWGLSFDVDIDKGISTRRRVFAMATSERLLVSGMHLGFPGYGHVVASGPTGFAFVPAGWRYKV